jgi:hypothetical protein
MKISKFKNVKFYAEINKISIHFKYKWINILLIIDLI